MVESREMRNDMQWRSSNGRFMLSTLIPRPPWCNHHVFKYVFCVSSGLILCDVMLNLHWVPIETVSLKIEAFGLWHKSVLTLTSVWSIQINTCIRAELCNSLGWRCWAHSETSHQPRFSFLILFCWPKAHVKLRQFESPMRDCLILQEQLSLLETYITILTIQKKYKIHTQLKKH